MDIIYDEFMSNWTSDGIDLHKDDFKIMLLSPFYHPLESHNFKDILKFEISSPNYVKGGQNIRFDLKINYKNIIVVSDDCSPISWMNLTANVRYAVSYKISPNNLKNVLISCLDLKDDLKNEEGLILNNDNLILSWPNDFLKIDKYVPPPIPPSEEELKSGLLDIGLLNKMELDKNIFIQEEKLIQ